MVLGKGFAEIVVFGIIVPGDVVDGVYHCLSGFGGNAKSAFVGTDANVERGALLALDGFGAGKGDGSGQGFDERCEGKR